MIRNHHLKTRHNRARIQKQMVENQKMMLINRHNRKKSRNLEIRMEIAEMILKPQQKISLQHRINQMTMKTHKHKQNQHNLDHQMKIVQRTIKTIRQTESKPLKRMHPDRMILEIMGPMLKTPVQKMKVKRDHRNNQRKMLIRQTMGMKIQNLARRNPIA